MITNTVYEITSHKIISKFKLSKQLRIRKWARSPNILMLVQCTHPWVPALDASISQRAKLHYCV